MKPVRNKPTVRYVSLGLRLVALGCGLVPASARGDGGTVQFAQETSGYRITIFTAPNPIRVGLVDTSVLVQDAETGDLVHDARVKIHMTPRVQPGEMIDVNATHEAATNKLLQAAVVTLPSPGRWDTVVDVEGPHGPARVRFEIEAAEPLPEWRVLWPWFSWPAVVILLFSSQQFLAQRRSH